LLQHTKARAFSFVGRDWGQKSADDLSVLIKEKPRISANPRLYFSPHAAGFCSFGDFSGVLMMLIQERMAKEQKKALICGYSNQGCAHVWQFRSFRVARR